MSSIKLDHNNAPLLIGSLKELAGRAGIRAPELHLTDSLVPCTSYHGAAHSIIISQGMLNLMECPHVEGRPTKEMQAVLAHEIGHAMKRRGEILVPAALLGSVVVAGQIAMYLVHKTRERMTRDEQSNRGEVKFWHAFGEVIEDTRNSRRGAVFEDFSKYTDPLTAKLIASSGPSWRDALLGEARSLAVMAACLVPGLAACRPLSIRSEFSHDRTAAMLMGDPKPLKEALGRLATAQQQATSWLAKSNSDRAWCDRISRAFRAVVDHTIDAHPSWIERIASLDAINAQRFHGRGL